MLISCPECGRPKVSDKALSCPDCGYPINSSLTTEKPVERRITKPRRAYSGRMKLPNGYGSIKFRSGKLRKPYVAYEPATEFNDNGSAIHIKRIGSYETYNEAYQALLDWHRVGIKDAGELTFKDVYSLWYKEKYEDKLSHYSVSSQKNAAWAYGQCKSLYDIPISKLGHSVMQRIIDDHADMSKSSVQNLLTLFNGICNYSVKNNLMAVNTAQYLVAKSYKKNEEGEPFTEEELKLLWEHSSDRYVQIILIYIYTGFRLSELKQVTIDYENEIFQGGIKTNNSKNRIVPFHPEIKKFIMLFDQQHFHQNNFGDKIFRRTLAQIGFEPLTNGKKHTPHDCRHTFAWLCNKYKVDDTACRMIMGHSLGKDVHGSTYNHRTVDELKAEMAKIQKW